MIQSRRVALLLVATLALVYWPVLAGQVLFFRDPANWTYPARLLVRQAILAGEVPAWNPLQAAGFPVLANPLHGVFYPPNWLYLAVPERLVIHMVTWQALAHLALGGLGVAALVRRLLPAMPADAAADVRRLPDVATVVAALAYCLSGYITSQWTAGLLLLADAWVPWCGVGFLALSRRLDGTIAERARGVALAALPFGAALLLGEVFVALMGAAFGIGTALVDRLSRPASGPTGERGKRAGRALLLFAAALALGLALGLATLLPAVRGAVATDRVGAFDRSLAEVASVHPVRLVEMVAPGAMGVPYEHFPGGRWLNEELLGGTPLSHGMYLGATVLALALLAFGRGQRLALGLGLLALFFLVVALGRHTPVHQVLRKLVPVMGFMRYPEKYMVLTTSWLAVLAGLGAHRALTAKVPRRRVLLFAGAVLSLAGWASLYPAELTPYVRRGAVQAAAAVALVVIALHLHRRRPVVGAALLVLVVLADLAAAAVPLQHFGPASVAVRPAPIVERIRAETRGDLAPPRAHRVKAAERSVARRFRVETHAEGQARAMQILAENASTTFGIGLLPGYDAAIPSAASSVWLEGRRHGFSVLRLFGAGHVVLPAPEGEEPAARLAALEPVFDPAPGARLYRVRQPLPRVYLAGRAEVPSVKIERPNEVGFGAELFRPEVLDGSVVHLEARDSAGALDAPPGSAGTCLLSAFGPRHVQARCQAQRAGVAVFLEQHAEGWQARLDGAPAPILLVNRLYRGVRMPPGDHTVDLGFNPPGLRPGLVISSLAALLLLGLMLPGRRAAAGSSPPGASS